jgi:hypothetical protein
MVELEGWRVEEMGKRVLPHELALVDAGNYSDEK